MKVLRAVLVASVVVASACGGGSATSPSDISTPVLVTDTFTGTLSPQTILTHTFNVAVAGPVSITLTAAGPPDTIQVGLGAGTPNSTTGTCGLEATVTTGAGTTAQISGTARAAGPLCVAIFDIGNLSADINYSINVSHP